MQMEMEVIFPCLLCKYCSLLFSGEEGGWWDPIIALTTPLIPTYEKVNETGMSGSGADLRLGERVKWMRTVIGWCDMWGKGRGSSALSTIQRWRKGFLSNKCQISDDDSDEDSRKWERQRRRQKMRRWITKQTVRTKSGIYHLSTSEREKRHGLKRLKTTFTPFTSL